MGASRLTVFMHIIGDDQLFLGQKMQFRGGLALHCDN